MRSFWVISIIMIGLVFMTTEFNCDDMKAARQDNEVFNGARGRMCDPLGHLWKIKIQTVNEVDFEEAKRKNAMGKTRMRRCRKAFTDC